MGAYRLKQRSLLVLFVTCIIAGCGGGGVSLVPDPTPDPPATSEKASLSALAITAPIDGAVVGGRTPVSSNADVLDGVTDIDFLVNGSVVADKANFTWITTKLTNGPHILEVVAHSQTGTVRKSITVIVDNKVPVWPGGHQPSSTGGITIDSVSPSSIPYGYVGEITIHGSGFYALDPEYPNTQVIFCPSARITGFVGNFLYPLIDSDTQLRVYVNTGEPMMISPYNIVIYEFQPAYPDGKIVAVSPDDLGFAVYQDSPHDPTVVSMSPSQAYSGYTYDFPIIITGANFPQDADYSVAMLLGDEASLGNSSSPWPPGIGTTRLQITSPSSLTVEGWDQYVPAGLYAIDLRFKINDQWQVCGTSYLLVEDSSGFVPPTLTISASSESGLTPLEVDFMSTADSNNPDGTITSYSWDFGNGNTSNEQNPTTAFSLSGSESSHQFIASCTVEDNYGYTKTRSVPILVYKPVPPSIEASASQTIGDGPLEVTLTGTAECLTPNGEITEYAWDFEDDGAWDYSDEASGTVAHIFELPAGKPSHSYHARFRASDSYGKFNDAVVAITVQDPLLSWNAPRIISITHSPDPVIVGKDQAQVNLQFEAASDNIDGEIVSCRWDFSNNDTWDSESFSPNASYPVPAGGSIDYQVRLEVTDNEGFSATQFHTLTVERSLPPAAYFTQSAPSQLSPSNVFLESTAEAFNGSSIIEWLWDIDSDGDTNYTGPSISHTFSAPDGEVKTWLVTHTVHDSYGRVGSFQQSVVVQGQPLTPHPPELTLSPQTFEGTGTSNVVFNVYPTFFNNAELASVNWYVNSELVSSGDTTTQFSHSFSVFGNQPTTHFVRVQVIDNNGFSASTNAVVFMLPTGSSGGGDTTAVPDLPPIQIQGQNGNGSYNAESAGIGDGVNGQIRQAFIDAYERSDGHAGRPTTRVWRWMNEGYIQELYSPTAGSGAIMMMDGQTEAVWIHGDISKKYFELGGASNYMGWPIKDEALGARSGVTGAESAYTLCKDLGSESRIYYHKNGPRQYLVVAVRGAIYQTYKQYGLEGGTLGLPITDQYPVGSNWRSDFEGGSVTWTSGGAQVYIKGQGSGGNSGGGGVSASAAVQAKVQTIPTSVLGTAITGIKSDSSVLSHPFSYQMFSGGDGWIGVVVYNPARGAAYYVRGAICKMWWLSNISPFSGVSCEGFISELGLPISDEFPDPNASANRRSNFERGHIIWDAATGLCYPYNTGASGPGSAIPAFPLGPLEQQVWKWFGQESQQTDYLQYTANDWQLWLTVALSTAGGPRGFTVKSLATGKVSAVITEEVFIERTAKSLGAGAIKEKQFVSFLGEKLAAAGRGEYSAIVRLFDVPLSESWKFAPIRDNANIRHQVAEFIRLKGEAGVSFLTKEYLLFPSQWSQVNFNVTDSIFFSSKDALSQAGLPVTKEVLQIVAKNSWSGGQAFAGEYLGAAKVFFYDAQTKLLFTMNESRVIDSVEKVDNAAAYLINGQGVFTNGVQLR